MPNGTFVESKIEDAKVLGADSGTYTFELPTSNYLQSLLLRFENTNGSTSNTGETIQGIISKIEIVGDGVTLFNMSGRLARKLEHFDMSDEPPANESQEGSAVQWAVFPIKFGRHAQDKDLLIPAHQLSSLQCKVTWSATDSTTAGWTTTESNLKMDVIARYLYSKERVNTPFLKKLEVYSKTPAATGTEEVTLPVGSGNGSYRRIMMYCREAAIEDGTDTTALELRVNDAQTLIEDKWNTLQGRNAVKYNARHTKSLPVERSDTDTYNAFMARINAASVASSARNHIAAVTAIAGDQITFGLGDSAGAAVTTDETIYVNIASEIVSHAVMLDLGTDNILDSLYVGAESGISSLKLKYTVGATGGDTRVVSEQLVQY